MGQLLDPKGKDEERRIGDYVFPKGWKIVLAGNRSTDRSGANKILRHCQDRTTAVQFTHDVDDWLAWADKNDVDLMVQAFIQYMPQLLWEFDPKDTNPQPSPRSWVRLSDTLKTEPPKQLMQKLFEGDVGQSCSIELMSFLALKNDVPNLGDICKGKDVDIVDSAGLCYATTIALVNVISQANENNVYKIRSRSDASDTQTHIQFENTNNIVGTIKTNGTATQFNTTSDYRLKTDLKTLK